jgi:5'-3' exonuclease
MITIIDANSLHHRAWHAARENTPAAGAIAYRLIRRACNDSDAALLCWDGSSKLRKGIYPAYKANRSRNLNLDLWLEDQQVKLQSQGWACHRHPDWEADDLAASYCYNFPQPTRLASSDRDWWGLINNETHVLLPGDWKTVTEKEMFAYYGVTPSQFCEYKALVGDSGDNIPGVPGIGPKRALAIIQHCWPLELEWEKQSQKFLDLESMFTASQWLTMLKSFESFSLAKQLVTLHTQAPCKPPGAIPEIPRSGQAQTSKEEAEQNSGVQGTLW